MADTRENWLGGGRRIQCFWHYIIMHQIYVYRMDLSVELGRTFISKVLFSFHVMRGENYKVSCLQSCCFGWWVDARIGLVMYTICKGLRWMLILAVSLFDFYYDFKIAVSSKCNPIPLRRYVDYKLCSKWIVIRKSLLCFLLFFLLRNV